MPATAKKSKKRLHLKGGQDQGNYSWKAISDLKIPSNPTREEYKAIYNTSEGDILKFQALYLSWKNISHNLVTVNEVLQSTGACHAAATAATILRVQPILQLPLRLNLLLVVNEDMQKHQEEESHQSTGPHFPPTDMTKTRTYTSIFFVVIPSGCHAEDKV